MVETVASFNGFGPIRLNEMHQGLASSPKKDLLLSLRLNLQPQNLGVKSGLASQILHIEHCFCQVNLAIVGVGHMCLLFGFVFCCNFLYYIIIHSFSKEARKTTRQKTLLRKLRRGRCSYSYKKGRIIEMLLELFPLSYHRNSASSAKFSSKY